MPKRLFIGNSNTVALFSIPASEGQPDWDYWAAMPGWHPSEAAALLLKLDPDTVDDEPMRCPYEQGTPRWKHFCLTRLLTRAVERGWLDDPVFPRRFITWCGVNGLDVPDELMQATRKRRSVRDWRRVARSRLREIHALRDELGLNLDGSGELELDRRVKKSMAAMIYAMASEKYGFTMNKRNNASEDIAAAIEAVNLDSPKEDTVRNILKDSYEQVKSKFA